MSSSDSDSDSGENKSTLLYLSSNSLEGTYLLNKSQLKFEIKKLETMLKATEQQKKIVETLKETTNILKKNLEKEK